MKTLLSLTGLLLCMTSAISQTNISITNTEAEQILFGNYSISTYPGLDIVSNHADVLCNLQDQLSTDSMLVYLEELEGFYTRHTHSDTLSDSTGIGAARRWVYSKMQDFSTNGSGRLVPAYLQFDQLGGPCGDDFGLRNVLGVLPGADLAKSEIIIVEAHMDSRCEGTCDIACFAPGMEDNGSGTALVMELARVMSQYTYDHTIVFMLTIGEEQGLFGAAAMADYCTNNNIEIKGVFNNDVIGGIECGTTSSPPSCPGLGDIDSLQVRLFSSGATATSSRNLARTVKMYYDEKIIDVVDIPMTVSIINREDRVGRGGDHIPFRQNGYPSIRFTSANEHGDAGVADTNYSDRQHTSGDVLGIDLTSNGQIDQYYVDLNYLKRNAVINGGSIALLASGPESPDITLFDEATGLRVVIQPDPEAVEYRIGVRTSSASLEFDEVYRTTDTSFIIPNQATSTLRFIAVASIDAETIMSPFGLDKFASSNTITPPDSLDDLPYGIDCSIAGLSEFEINNLSPYTLECYPNPWTESTTIEITSRNYLHSEVVATIELRDIQGRLCMKEKINLTNTTSTVTIDPVLKQGIYTYSLIIDGTVLETKRMIKLR